MDDAVIKSEGMSDTIDSDTPWASAISIFFSPGGPRSYSLKMNERKKCPLGVFISHDGQGRLCIQLKGIKNTNQIDHLGSYSFRNLLTSDLEGHQYAWHEKGIKGGDSGVFGIYYDDSDRVISKKEWVLKMLPLFLNAAERITALK